MVKKTAEKSYGGMAARTSSSELSENNPRQNFRLGDITWVKHGGSSWWPAQVIDEASVSSKPKKKTGHDALVRLYGTCQYLYVDPWKSNMEFEMILKEGNKTAMEAFHEVLQKELTHFKSPSDHDEEPVSTKATAKTSVKKVRKREGYSADQDKEVGSNATTGVAVQERRKLKGARQASPLDKGPIIDKASSEDSAEGLKDKTRQKASAVRDKKGRKMVSSVTSVVRKEGSRRSGRTNAKEYLDAAEDSTSQDTSASENATEVGDITSASRSQHRKGSVDGTHREIKGMVRDILLGDVIARQHVAEMAYVDGVIFGICDATEGKTTHGTTADSEGGRSIKRAGNGLEADSSNVAKRARKGRATNLETKDCQNSSPGWSHGGM